MAHDFTFHPLAEMFPSMSDDDLQTLAKDLKDNGQIQPILLLDKQIIDGCNRYRACQLAGIEPITKEYTGPTDEESLIKFVTSSNLNRRQLDSSQRAALAIKLLPMLEKAAKERQRAAGGNHGNQHTTKNTDTTEALVQGIEQVADAETVSVETKTEEKRSIEQAADIVGTNKQYVAFAKEIQEKRPDLLADVLGGEITIPKAIKEVRSTEKSEKKPSQKEPMKVMQIIYPKSKPASKQDLLNLMDKISNHPDSTDTTPILFTTGKTLSFELIDHIF